ncbi:MAG: phosphate ABC transporter, permease protein PstA [Rhodobiaceae bacterium]|nr:phosphate ABC transporter, permease protein PstA [Rhodobiaceae bacterium]|tara:strand:- start:2020 stop:3261 length:1242 start_codon:yes stop_codon:yes gene_type:complete
MNKNIRNLTLKRQFAEKRFKFYGQISLFLALVMLVVIISSMTYRSIPAFTNYGLNLNINLSENDIDKDDINYRRLIRENIFALDSGCEDRKCRREFSRLFSSGAAYDLKDSIENNPSLIKKNFNKFILFSDDADLFYKFGIDKNLPENERRLNDREISWLNDFQEEGLVEKRFSTNFFTNGDSREPEIAGVLGAVVGSLFTILITLIISFPIGVFSAIYLESFAPKNKLTDFIEVNINNLAAVPSIVFGLLGLALFINFFGMPRSAPLVGGCVLSLMTLPVIIIATRASLQAVPPSIREAALAIGASEMQVVFQHLFPAALPGILTGTIIGLARAFGESAPLLLIGMVAFVVDIPGSVTDPATALPVQVYLWADSPERAFVAKTSAATLVLIFLLIVINLAAVILRKKYQLKW